MKTDIKDLTIVELENEIIKLSLPKYRAGQIATFIYKKGVNTFEAMSSISKELRSDLGEKFVIGTIALEKHLKSRDGTEKFLFKLSDGKYIETVLIRSKKRNTLCISTQVGCKFRCKFCASGLKGFKRDLSPSEIVNQILYIQHTREEEITNCVFMGMGEPLDNYKNLTRAIEIMNDPKGLEIGARRITVSTCGIIPGIQKLKNLGVQINLSVSLHAGNNKLRNELVPINKRYPLERLIKVLREYHDKTNRIITLEYVLIDGVNDSKQDITDLAGISKALGAKVNIIPYSAIKSFRFKTPQKIVADRFCYKLIQSGAKATVRESKGADIQSACGQLSGMI
ncbi:23S rRNA (adenine(2503)-C(2))-methyltransferase RlmN [Candidatus Omnitrophota bacterium]